MLFCAFNTLRSPSYCDISPFFSFTSGSTSPGIISTASIFLPKVEINAKFAA